jgi:large subunit ribosomal protein L9
MVNNYQFSINSKMNIILLEHIDKVGAKHDVVKVKDGFGRNYLIPQGLGIVANKPNLARLEGMKKQGSKKEAVIIAAFKEVVAKLAGVRVKIAAKAGENGRLFGSVTAQHLSNALRELGVDAEKRIIEMPEEVKELGSYTAVLKFHPEVEASIKFDVENEGGNEVELDD